MDTAAIVSQLPERSIAERVRHVRTTCGTRDTMASTVATVPMPAMRSASRIGQRQAAIERSRAELWKGRAAGRDVERAIAIMGHWPAARAALDRRLSPREFHYLF